jgi:hypothetical protein
MNGQARVGTSDQVIIHTKAKESIRLFNFKNTKQPKGKNRLQSEI